eukprot:Protomagalhaensia_sp_Gyna_25__5315@NODE_667_length_2877_cov_177_423538_g521_i0_p1_GENE_NODE_667_length_2877_cov_177_423538_g521_i0NODE_667_length_2877_cov_177_423538_g521_i0_p1_ORF_typecomplete_len204_score25_42Synaptobrevin/PF00957_21/1_2e16Longin/PF13774_6/5_5e10Mannitol_dh_C/PF08125_13/0_011Cyclase_polyket/PF04673_12/0_1Cyclase_polyket/PF04673_12/5_4e03_NODE_667_length_2877_cov_177_423538_g521_i013781989
MKLVSLLIFHVKDEKAVLLSSHMDLSHFNYFVRGTVKEHVLFHSRLICARTPVGTRQTIQFEQDLGSCHAYTHSCGIAGAVLSDPEYPARVAFVLINRALAAFVEKYSPETWDTLTSDPPTLFAFPQGDELLKHFQNPNQADDLSRIQADLNEVRDIMIVNIEQLLKRGEQLESLMEKTDDLSKASEQFFRTTKANNQCCKWY